MSTNKKGESGGILRIGAQLNGRMPLPPPRGPGMPPHEIQQWTAKMVADAADTVLVHAAQADGFIYFAFQDKPAGRGVILDAAPMFGRVPLAALINAVGFLASLGTQVRIVPPEQTK